MRLDRIQAMQIFVRVAEAESFIHAAETLSLPASTVTNTVKNLEKYLQVRLLNRTTRRVSLTTEGAEYLIQCREILDLIEHTESNLTNAIKQPQGRLRVDMPAGIAHSVIMPNLQKFQQRYPDIYLMISVSDRQVDLIKEGVDCVIRMGNLENSTLVARPLGKFRWITCASAAYLKENGVPQILDDLKNHRVIHYFSGNNRHVGEMHFERNGEKKTVQINSTVAVNETELYIKMCLGGYGLAQLAERLVVEHLKEKTLIAVLQDWCPPPVAVTLLYPHQRFVSPAVRVFSDWMAELINDRQSNFV
ncbi:LysR family transcriptional regulator [Acinetobacter sp. AYS6]|uniref:LysR family transcriptional regulator n=1 Tax=Acinetobacter sp. AYS6 TaxID=2983297 RepID=UPI0021D648C0|nr:LysR family transcriptional regulator [Acinetobacter sp. AYS6]MCU7696990.1 LysR family transcriptional regulator [Acinetobacter sp. AYS6]